MTYPTIETVNATNDLSQILVYTNTITNGYFMPLVLFAFFCIICMGSFFAQLSFTGRGKFHVSFAVAGFSTFGLSTFLLMEPGLINPIAVGVSLGAAILGAAWVYFAEE